MACAKLKNCFGMTLITKASSVVFS